jgi:hypothetical protein
MSGILFCLTNGQDSFPCNASAIEAVSLGLAAGAVSLLFTLWLYRKVRHNTEGKKVGE